MEHTHDDDRLTFGCPGCIAKVAEDQRVAALEELPLRPLEVEWHASVSQSGVAIIDARYSDDESPFTVADRCEREIYDLIKHEDIFYVEGVDWEIETATFGDASERRRA